MNPTSWHRRRNPTRYRPPAGYRGLANARRSPACAVASPAWRRRCYRGRGVRAGQAGSPAPSCGTGSGSLRYARCAQRPRFACRGGARRPRARPILQDDRRTRASASPGARDCCLPAARRGDNRVRTTVGAGSAARPHRAGSGCRRAWALRAIRGPDRDRTTPVVTRPSGVRADRRDAAPRGESADCPPCTRSTPSTPRRPPRTSEPSVRPAARRRAKSAPAQTTSSSTPAGPRPAVRLPCGRASA